jgi:hypothetical protein
VECRPGYKRVRLCVREDLYRAMVIIEASEGVKRYRLIEEALTAYLDSKRSFGGGFRILTISEDLYRELVNIGGGSVETGLRLLLEAYQSHQLVVPGTQSQPQARSQVESREGVRLDFLEDNPWVSIIKNRHTATSTPSREF